MGDFKFTMYCILFDVVMFGIIPYINVIMSEIEDEEANKNKMKGKHFKL